MQRIIMALPARFWAKTIIENAGYESPCLTWTAFKQKNGYGKFGKGGKSLYAHRVAYEALVGPIPKGLVIDHLCRNRACVNADHMEAVTNRVNILRGETVMAANAAKTHCPQGHEYSPENTGNRRMRIGRHCLECARIHNEIYCENRRAGRGTPRPKATETHCANGHPFDEANTYRAPNGGRACRACSAAARKRWLERRKATAEALRLAAQIITPAPCPICRKSPSTPHTGATMAAHADRMTRTGNSGMCPAPPTRRGGPQLDRDTEWEYEQERADYDD